MVAIKSDNYHRSDIQVSRYHLNHSFEDPSSLSIRVAAEASRGSIQSMESVLKFMYVTKWRLLNDTCGLQCLFTLFVWTL